ncbi:MAG: hypothetical protein J7M20_07095, partial [Deltaproteobacteria bacterium]|nr:hypothetical protein [Deltaproteobacteria bacterium]
RPPVYSDSMGTELYQKMETTDLKNLDSYKTSVKLYNYLKGIRLRTIVRLRKAIKIDPYCQHAYYGMCYLQLLRRNEESIVHNAYKMIQLNPNAGFLTGVAGWFLAIAGKFDEGFRVIEKSRKLNPVTPSWFQFPCFIFNYIKGDYCQALETAKAFELQDFFWSPLMHAAVFGKMRKIDEAKAALCRLLLLKPDFPQRAHYYVSSFVISDNWVDKILEGLFEAGFGEARTDELSDKKPILI